MVKRTGRQEEGQREAPRQAFRRVLNLRVVGHLLRALGNLGWAAADALEAAAAVLPSSAFRAFCPSAAAPPKGAAKTEKGSRKVVKG
jgi:hypothetical protein